MEHRRDFVDRHHGLKLRKNGQQKTCNLSCNIAAKRVVQRCCAFYHQHKTCLAPNQVVNSFCSSVEKHVARFFFFPFFRAFTEKEKVLVRSEAFSTRSDSGEEGEMAEAAGGKGTAVFVLCLFVCQFFLLNRSFFIR